MVVGKKKGAVREEKAREGKVVVGKRREQWKRK